MFDVKSNLEKVNESEDLLEEALSLSDNKENDHSKRVEILMEKNRWTIDFGYEVGFYLDHLNLF